MGAADLPQTGRSWKKLRRCGWQNRNKCQRPPPRDHWKLLWTCGTVQGDAWITLRDAASVRVIRFISLVPFGLYNQAGRVCYVLVVLGPHKLGVRGQIAAFKVQRDDAVVVDVHNDVLSAWGQREQSWKGPARAPLIGCLTLHLYLAWSLLIPALWPRRFCQRQLCFGRARGTRTSPPPLDS